VKDFLIPNNRLKKITQEVSKEVKEVPPSLNQTPPIQSPPLVQKQISQEYIKFNNSASNKPEPSTTSSSSSSSKKADLIDL